MTRSSADSPPPAPIDGTTLHPGTGSGRVLKLESPLSFWGGTGHDGRIIDRHHPQYGSTMAGRVLAMTSGRGSSSSSSVLAEQLRAGTGPVTILMTEADAIVVLGAIVADELYGIRTPVVLLSADDFAALPDGAGLSVDASAERSEVTVTDRTPA
ncbi:MAG TPA: aconitase subunit 2 [Streptomyces sp.]|nr:aconitase subunit 2 [Streptomyces sp.]